MNVTTQSSTTQRTNQVAGPSASLADIARARMDFVGVDDYLANKAGELAGLGHWVCVKRTSEGGNRAALLEMATAPGEQPQPTFGDFDYHNTLIFSVAPLSTGEVQFSVQGRRIGAVTNSTVPASYLNAAVLAEAFAAFRALADRKTAKHQV